MPVRMRLHRVGAKHQPSYRIVVTPALTPRDGSYLDQVGFYNPRTEPATISIDSEKVVEWLKKGVEPSDRVVRLLETVNIVPDAIRRGEPIPSEPIVKKERKKPAKKAEATAEPKAEAPAAAKTPEAEVAEAAPAAVSAEAEEAANVAEARIGDAEPGQPYEEEVPGASEEPAGAAAEAAAAAPAVEDANPATEGESTAAEAATADTVAESEASTETEAPDEPAADAKPARKRAAKKTEEAAE